LLADNKGDSEVDLLKGNQNSSEHSTHTSLYNKLRGLPQRPFYHELLRRLLIIQQHHHIQLTDSTYAYDNTLFLPASHFGMEEYQPLDSTIPSPTLDTTSVEECTRWIQTAGESGIYAMLGMRRTVGTVSRSLNNDTGQTVKLYLLPPSSNQLIKTCQKRHKPNSKSRLTVAASALAKHANRSISESKQSFYGTFYGSESEKKTHKPNVSYNIY
jgi:hypothetical protein